METDAIRSQNTILPPTKDAETGQTKCIKGVKPSTKASTVTRQEDGPTKITVPVSSTAEDRDGDNFTEEGLKDMVDQLSSGEVPLYLDHGLSPETMFPDYRVLEMRGYWENAEVDDNGVVMATAVLREGDDDAQELANMIDQGLPVGFSVGFIIHDYEEKEDGGLLFQSIDMLETSGVGIPSNPDGVAQAASAAAVAVKDALGDRKDVPSPDSIEKGVKAFMKAAQEDEEKDLEEDTEQEDAVEDEGDKDADPEQVDDADPEETDDAPDGKDEDEDDEDEETDSTDEEEDEEEDSKQDVDDVVELLEELVDNQQAIMARLEDLLDEDDNEEEDQDEDDGEEETDEGDDEDDDTDADEDEEEEDDEKSHGDKIETLEDDKSAEDNQTTDKDEDGPDPEDYRGGIRRY